MKHIMLTALESDNIPLWKELWQYFYETYYNNPVYYEHLGMDTDDLIMVKNLIIGLFIGLSVAAFAVVFNKRVLGGFVRRLLRNECLSPESAKTLEELDAKKNTAIRNAVRRSVNLRRVVKCREEEEFLSAIAAQRTEYEEKQKTDPSLPAFKEATYRINADTDHFYIPEDMKYMADVKFEAKGSTWLVAVLCVVIFAVVSGIILKYLPNIFQLLNDFVGSFSSAGNKNIL